MPFDFKEYQTKCDGMSTEELHKEMENYTRQLSGGATSTATSILLAPYTGGASLLALGLSTPKVHNARKKRAIIEAGLQARGTTHNTRKRDVIAPMAVTGAINTLTLGLAGPIASTVAGQVVGHGVEYATTHVALDAGGSLIEHHHGKQQKIKAEEKLNAQYANFKIQYAHEQVAVHGIQSPVAGYQPGSIQGYQPASPLSPTGANLPGPPQSPYQKYEPTAIPASYDTRPHQTVTQQQTNFYAGGAFGFHANQTTSYQQANISAQQVSSYQPQQNSSTQQSVTPTAYPAERPLIMSGPSSSHSTPTTTTTTTTTVPQATPASLQHRPSLPTPSVTAHTPVHRPSLPTNTPNATAPQTPASPSSGIPTGQATSSKTEAVLSMEQELAFLRLKIAAMELGRRGEHVGVPIEELEDDEEDEDEDEDEKPKSPEIPETFPIEAWAPEPSRKMAQDVNGITPAGTTSAATTGAVTTSAVTTPAVETSYSSSSPKLNVFVPLQQPTPQHIAKPAQGPHIPQNVPYPTFSTPQPERQHYQSPLPQFSAPPVLAALKQEASKTGLSISGGISIKYNRDSTQSQASQSTLAPNVVPRPASVPPPQHWQLPNMTQGNPISLPGPPQQQATTYQTYNSHQRPPSAPTSPQQLAASQNQGVMVPYKPGPPPQQSNTGLQTYNPAQQAAPPNNQHQQQTYSQPANPPPPLQHQDSGYYSNPSSSRHSSTFSVSGGASMSFAHSQQVVSPPTPAFSTPNAQSPGSPQQYNPAQHSYGQMPLTYTPSPMSPPTQQYFPPPPANAPPPNKDYFGQNNRVSTPNPQMQGYQQALPAPPTPFNQGWQWGNSSTGAPGEPNYAPQPIPGKWRGS